MGLAQPTVGRHVSTLEAAARAALFSRSQTGLTPTALALALAPHADAMASTAEALNRSVANESANAQGVVRISASEIIGVEVLLPLLVSFRDSFSDIQFELQLGNMPQNLLQREADIAIRMTRPVQKKLLMKKLSDVRYGLYAHKSYIKRRPVLNNTPSHNLSCWKRWK